MTDALPARRHRADERATNQLTASTLASYNSAVNRYKRLANERGLDARLPENVPLVALFKDYTVAKGRRAANQLRGALVHYFLNEGVPVAVDHPQVIAAIDTDHSASELETFTGRTRRAAWYASNAYAASVVSADERVERKWVAYADSHAFVPIEPTVPQLETYIAEYAKERAANTVCNHVNGISHYFRHHGVADLTRTDRIKDVLEGIKRCIPSKKWHALQPEHAAAAARTCDLTAPLDVRDALMLAITANSGLAQRHLRAFDRSRVRFTPDGVIFHTLYERKHDFYVPNGPYPETNVSSLLKRWLGIVGTDPGPVFAGLTARGVYGNVLSPARMTQIMQRRLKAAAIDGVVGPISFRKGWVQRNASDSHAVAAADAGGYRHIRALRHYVSGAGRELDLMFAKTKIRKRSERQ